MENIETCAVWMGVVVEGSVKDSVNHKIIATFHVMLYCCWLGIWLDEICVCADCTCFYRSIKCGEMFLRRFLDRPVL